MEFFKRTVNCGILRHSDAGTQVVLNGWVHRKREHGGISFINMRDRYGITQVVVDAHAPPELAALAAQVHNEYCIAVEGTVRERPPAMVNPEMPTGAIEVAAQKIVVLNSASVLPFQIDEESNANEELRLKYRYLDLRSGGMQNRIRLRSAVTFAVREWMHAQDFYEIETPTFVKSTPEGARDYLVPSRLYSGKFYALPQSPQLYKQLLMAAGFDKYVQIARCYRDEDARGDRQPEFTQIDIEMSFVSRDDILTMTEELLGSVFKKTLNLELPAHFTRLSYHEAQERYGTDKPDLRFALPLQDFSAFAERSSFSAFKDALAQGEAQKAAGLAQGITIAGGAVKVLVVSGGAGYSRKQIEELEAQAKIYKAKVFAWMKVAGTSGEPVLEGGAAKFFATQAGEIVKTLGAQAGDLLVMTADAKRRIANNSLGAVRSKLGKDLGLCDPDKFEWVWIVDFPLFEFNEEEGHWEAAHHMFSYPQERYHASLESDPGAVIGDLYDLVLNGCELASGSIRIHEPVLQKRIFTLLGLDPAEAEEKFGFLTTAFKFGAPPHGGIALGFDRLVMLMAGQTSIKEVIAFPKNSFALSPLDDCPSEVTAEQLQDLHIMLKDKKDKH
ncbi:MAG: aspartate--tRNA ligase [Spirochaetaceae bacterium]|jgi:aspartyl-tRNA synthetase|nr:aspartate--tRNA ligase [Spirochaetaceae bacterium]